MAIKQILVVEDELIVADYIRKSLQNMGYSVPAIASSGEKALLEAERTCPDLVLMDIVLEGEIDGIEAAHQIHSRFNIPVVFLTAYSDDEIMERAKIIEPFGYVIKPFNERELQINIEIALYKHKMEEELRKYRGNLEELVKERTAELEEKNANLQTILKGFVNQENRMADIKKKNMELEKEIFALKKSAEKKIY